MALEKRPRRLRINETVRALARETRVSKSALVYPLFIREGMRVVEDIPSLPGQQRCTPDRLPFLLESQAKAGIKNILLFGLPDCKDEIGSSAWKDDGAVQLAIREVKKHFPQINVVTDVCLCEYTSHGHCGVIENGAVSNDKTLPLLARVALSHARAGADMVAPSDMMDGRVAAIRSVLDGAGLTDTAIMSYAVKYASAFYGPFRDAAGSAPAFGDRKSYQMDFHNSKEALREAALDVEEGADILIVKPAFSYLDIVAKISEAFPLPVAAYSVSGEYSMIRAAAGMGLMNEEAAVCESAVSAFRAGADILITYFAPRLAKWIDEGRLG